MSIRVKLYKDDIQIFNHSLLKNNFFVDTEKYPDEPFKIINNLTNPMVQKVVDTMFDCIIDFNTSKIKVLKNFCYHNGDVYHIDNLPSKFPDDIKKQIQLSSNIENDISMPTWLASDDYVLLYLYNNFNPEDDKDDFDKCKDGGFSRASLYYSMFTSLDESLQKKHEHHFSSTVTLYSPAWFIKYHEDTSTVQQKLKKKEHIPFFYIQQNVDTFNSTDFKNILLNHNTLMGRRLVAEHCKDNKVLQMIASDQDKEIKKLLKNNKYYKVL